MKGFVCGCQGRDTNKGPGILRSLRAGGLNDGKAEKVVDEATGKARAIDPENVLKRSDEFDFDFLELYMHDPFIGACSMDVTKVADSDCPTAYIGVRKNGARYDVIMGYSPKFFRSMTREERKGVIRHEMYHMIFHHIFHRAVAGTADQKLWNWATDLAINSIIGAENLPKLCLIPGIRPLEKQKDGSMKPASNPYADFIAGAKKLEASDYYFEELKKIRDEQGDGEDDLNVIFDAMGTMDDHDGWGQIDPETAEELRDKMRDIVERAMKKADRNNEWGTVPQSIQEMLRKMMSKEVDWRSVIRNFIGRSRSLERNSTIKRINKKMPYIHPGVKRPLIANFACFMDQSGSMADEDIALLFSELGSLATLTQLDVYHFDTEIDEKSHKVWRKGDANPQCLRTRCGGTDFDSVANFANRHDNRGRWSGIIILTDGYAPVMSGINGARVLWVVTPTGTMAGVRPGDLAVQMSKDSGKFKPY